MWLALVQGKETHRVSDDVLQAVMTDLYERQHVRDPADISQKRVRDSLRHLRLRKAYDHVAQVTARLSGLRAQRIPPETEEKLKNMFLQMQPAFKECAQVQDKLSFLFVCAVPMFSNTGSSPHVRRSDSTQGRDKLEANDAIFRKMCVELGWPVFDLPPASVTTM